MLPAAPPFCPHCGQLDQTRKVRGLYAAGAGRFAPPARPTGARWLMRCFTVVLVLLGLLTASCALLGLLVWYLAGTDSLPLVALAVGIPLLVLVAVSSIALVWRAWERRRLHGPLAVWEAEMIAWDERFYCVRCDDTFVPLPSTSSPYTGQTIRWTK